MTDAATSAPPSGLARFLTVASAVMGTIVYVVTLTIIGVALPYMQGTFSAAPDQLAWLVTSFIIGTAVMTAASGWLSTRFGRKRIFVASIAGFTISSVMCGFATGLDEIVIWRTLQGLLGAPLIPLGQAITIDAFPREKQALGTALWGMGAVSGSVVGPYVGGYLVEAYSWPWVFFINLPIGLLALVGAIAFVPETPRDAERRLDWFGFATIMAAIIATQLMLNRGERLGWFGSTEILIETGLAMLALYLLVTHSLTTHRPFLEVRLFLNANFSISLFFIFVYGLLTYLPVFLLPLLLQGLGGYSMTSVGALLGSRGLGVLFGLAVIGLLIARVDARILAGAGFLSLVVSGWGMSLWSMEIRTWDVIWTGFIQGIGAGVTFVPISVLAFSTMPERLRTEGLAFLHLMLNMGTAVGVAAIFNVLSRGIQINHEVMAAHVNPYNDLFRYRFSPEAWDLSEPSGLIALDAEITRQATMIAYNNSFYLIAIVGIVVIPLLFLLRAPPRGEEEDASRGRTDDGRGGR